MALFKVSVWPAFLLGCAWGIPVGVAIVFCLGPFYLDAILFSLFGGVLAGFVFAWVMSGSFAIQVTNEGIRGHTALGIPRFIRWNEVSSVCNWRLLNVRFLRVKANTGGSEMWLPMNLQKMSEFKALVHELAPPDCALARALAG